jgi:hypothetical protein
MIYSVSTIAAQLSPTGAGGIQSLDVDTFKLYCFKALTGEELLFLNIIALFEF